MSTSPFPLENVCSASRALLSCTGTCLKTWPTYAVACASVLPCWICAPYAAITFQRAPPEVNGFGSSTWTPGLTRSSHVLMPFGLPLRTTNATTEFVTKPCVGPLVQLELTSPAFTSLSTSGASESATTSAGRPDATARDWSPEAPYDWVNVTPLPAGVSWNAGISLA